ncbi:MAG: TetR-like C-terminal domain-containing protein [Romboutsia sp.]
MAKNPVQVALTKQNLKEAFWSLYKIKRINQISIKEITDKAGYNRGTFYLYYQDVYDMLSQIEDELLNQLDDISQIVINLVISSDNNSEESDKFFKYFKDNIAHISVLLGGNGDAYFQAKYKEMLKNYIREHLRVEKIDYSEETIDFTLEFLISGVIGLILYYFSENKEPDVDALKRISSTVIGQSGIKELLK